MSIAALIHNSQKLEWTQTAIHGQTEKQTGKFTPHRTRKEWAKDLGSHGGWILTALHQGKRARCARIPAIRFQPDDVLTKQNYGDRKQICDCRGPGGTRGKFLRWWNSYIMIVVVVTRLIHLTKLTELHTWNWWILLLYVDYTSIKRILETKNKKWHISFWTYHPIYFFHMAVLFPLTTYKKPSSL